MRAAPRAPVTGRRAGGLLRHPRDEALRWRGTAGDGRPVVRVAHYGDCGWREMPLSHGVHTPPGYPRYMGERLAAAGIGMEFSSVVAGRFEHLPHDDPTRHLRLTGDPDVVFVHSGALYTRLVVLPDRRAILVLRTRIARRLGRHVFTGYRLLRPLVLAFGWFVQLYEGPEALERFLVAVRRRWPRAHVAVLTPYPRALSGRRQRRVERRVREDVIDAAARTGTELIDVAPLLPAPVRELRCANGYNLNERGSALVGRRLADWALARIA